MTRSQIILALVATAFTAFVIGASMADKPAPVAAQPKETLEQFTDRFDREWREAHRQPPGIVYTTTDPNEQLERDRQRQLREREVEALERSARAQQEIAENQ